MGESPRAKDMGNSSHGCVRSYVYHGMALRHASDVIRMTFELGGEALGFSAFPCPLVATGGWNRIIAPKRTTVSQSDHKNRKC